MQLQQKFSCANNEHSEKLRTDYYNDRGSIILNMIRTHGYLKIKFLLIVLLLICSYDSPSAMPSNLSGDCRNDSTVITTYYQRSDVTPNVTAYTEVKSFDLDSGLFNRSIQNGIPWTATTYSNGVWDDNDTTFSLGGQIEEILTRRGSVTGWNNYFSVTYSYSPTGLITEQTERTWNGSAWDSLSHSFWLYDLQDRLTGFERYVYISGQWNNDRKLDVAYSGIHPFSKTYSRGSGSTWTNDSLLVFTYADTLRTMLDISFWDSTLATWTSYAQVPYQLIEGDWVARITRNFPITVSGIPTVDTVVYDLDTLENIMYWKNAQFTVMDTVNLGNNESSYSIVEYNLYHGEVKIHVTTYSESMMDIVGGDTLWYEFFRPIVETYSYDQNNRLVLKQWNGGCTNPCSGYDQFAYDSTGFLYAEEMLSSTMVSDRFTFIHHYVVDSSAINILVPDWDLDPYVCRGSEYQPHLLLAGGCQPYHVQWIPATGLSSDTILDPVITVGDSIMYTVVAQDNSGHSDTLYYNVYPALEETLTVDTSGCFELAILSVVDIPNVYYRWYKDGQLISGLDSNICVVTQPGNYSVQVSVYSYSPYYGSLGCEFYSDTITVSIPVVFQSGDSLYTNLPAVTYEWYVDGVLYASGPNPYVIANVSGDYSLILVDSSGCERESGIYPVITSGISTVANHDVHVYPNPVINILSVSTGGWNENAELIIRDVTGKEVLHQKMKDEHQLFDVSELSVGLYILSIKSGTNVSFSRFVIER